MTQIHTGGYRRFWALLTAAPLAVAFVGHASLAREPDNSESSPDASAAPAAKISDTWSTTVPIAGLAPDTMLGKWRIWVEEGWLLAERRSSEDEVEWKVVLAKVAGDEPPEIEANRPPDSLRLSYRDGRYFIREAMGSFRCLREPKTEEEAWPELEIPARDANSGSGHGHGNSSSVTFQFSNSWKTIAAGPQRGPGKPIVADSLVRIAHRDLNGGIRFTHRPGAPARVSSGEWFLIDDGTLLVAERVEAWRLQAELNRQAGRAQAVAPGFGAPPGRVMAVRRGATSGPATNILKGSPAPELSGEVWLNAEQPPQWKELHGKPVLLVLFDLRQPSFVPLVPPLLGFQDLYGKQGLVVIGVHQSCPRGEVEKRMADERIKFPVLIDDGKTGPRYILGFSSSFLIDRDGKVVVGYKDLLVPPAEIEQLLNAKQGAAD